MGNGAAAFGAEDAVDVLARRALAGPGLGGALDGELVLGDDGYEGWREGGERSVRLSLYPFVIWKLTVGRAGLALAVVTVVVPSDEGRVDVDRIGDGLAEAVSGERHGEYVLG